MAIQESQKRLLMLRSRSHTESSPFYGIQTDINNLMNQPRKKQGRNSDKLAKLIPFFQILKSDRWLIKVSTPRIGEEDMRDLVVQTQTKFLACFLEAGEDTSNRMDSQMEEIILSDFNDKIIKYMYSRKFILQII